MVVDRELCAAVRQVPFAPPVHDAEEMARYERVVEVLFQHGAVLPAPFGTVFRSPEQVRRWLGMNTIALSEGLHYVEGRCETRVHMVRNPAVRPVEGPGEMAGVAAECFRALRRDAVAARTLRQDNEILSAAFLISDEEWEDFAEQVQEQAARHAELTFRQTGPWPPYDFVHIEFGG